MSYLDSCTWGDQMDDKNMPITVGVFHCSDSACQCTHDMLAVPLIVVWLQKCEYGYI